MSPRIHCLVRTIPAIRLATFNTRDRLEAATRVGSFCCLETADMKLLRFHSPPCPGRCGGSQRRAVVARRGHDHVQIDSSAGHRSPLCCPQRWPCPLRPPNGSRRRSGLLRTRTDPSWRTGWTIPTTSALPLNRGQHRRQGPEQCGVAPRPPPRGRVARGPDARQGRHRNRRRVPAPGWEAAGQRRLHVLRRQPLRR